ncbi:MAG: CobW family GTP-binding protein [Pseudomonadota bacterium]
MHETLDPRPFTVIAGFLGAGKTTLVNRILTRSSGTRFAVMVNDFGAINIDAGLIASHDGQTIALTNGCVCCTMSDGFIQAMLRLMATPQAFDHVVIEASGVAEPSKIMDFARLDPLLDPDAVVTLVDAETLIDRLADPKISAIVTAQIRQADILLLTKSDLADPDAAEAQLARIHPLAKGIRASHGNVPLELVLGTGLWSPKSSADNPALDLPFHTLTLRCDRPIAHRRFADWGAALPQHILRGKGVAVFDDQRTMLWQRVGIRNTLTPAASSADPSEIVLIGTEPIDIAPLG